MVCMRHLIGKLTYFMKIGKRVTVVNLGALSDDTQMLYLFINHDATSANIDARLISYVFIM